MKIILIILIAILGFNCGNQKIESPNSDTKKRITEEDTIERSKIVGKYKTVIKNSNDSSFSKDNFEFSLRYYYNFSMTRNIVEKYEIDSNKIIIRYKRGSSQEFREEKIVYEILNGNELQDKDTEIKYQKF